MVEQVQQIKSQRLLDLYIQRKVEWQGRVYPFHYLPRLLGDTHAQPGNAALQLGAAAAQRPDVCGHPRRRNGRARRKSS